MDDIAQNALVKLAKNQSYDPSLPAAPFIESAVHSVVCNAAKKATNQHEYFVALEDDAADDGGSKSPSYPGEASDKLPLRLEGSMTSQWTRDSADADEILQRLACEEHLHRLSQPVRRYVELMLAGFNYEEISMETGDSKGKISMRISRYREGIKRKGHVD
jgi:DNA-directed RNA polymerase specialized sigma24 family protein